MLKIGHLLVFSLALSATGWAGAAVFDAPNPAPAMCQPGSGTAQQQESAEQDEEPDCD